MREWTDVARKNEGVGLAENSVTKRDLFLDFWSLPENINSDCLKCLNGVAEPFPVPMPGLNNKTTEISQIRYDLFDIAGCDFMTERYN